MAKMFLSRPDTYDHEDLPALTLARIALNALEGLLWRSVRGAGLAYGANVAQDVERGFTYFNVSHIENWLRGHSLTCLLLTIV